jgi:hypothetical protein
MVRGPSGQPKRERAVGGRQGGALPDAIVGIVLMELTAYVL